MRASLRARPRGTTGHRGTWPDGSRSGRPSRRRPDPPGPSRSAPQTATGSRYSPKTDRRTPQISPSVAYAAAQRDKCGMRFVSHEPGRAAATGGRRVRPRPRRRRARDASAPAARAGSERRRRTPGAAGLDDLVGVGEAVHPDDPTLAGVELALEPIGRVGDLALRVALGDRRDHPAAPVDLVEVAPDRGARSRSSAPRRTTIRRAGRPCSRRRSPRR